ncbi:type VII toxin-antitoxin system HepT family RNase toxin [Desulfosediminicola flagellatus]|uniref:type VII toxin-antitoxin system HepT family RNase toxin n=1 Tax=Desulfosediminicola flagellatus TaxID=2569541 RepID=UPI0010ACA44D|nr:DUF86 domain-containing protein [Desulfosediminicola flagellatus]
MRERINQKIFRAKEYLANIEQLAPACSEKFHTDFVYRGALLHYLYLMADSCISLAEMVIKQHGLRPPQSYTEAFDILGEANVLDPEFARSFSKIAGFRNFLAHDYETVDAEVICGNILTDLSDVYVFIQKIESL